MTHSADLLSEDRAAESPEQQHDFLDEALLSLRGQDRPCRKDVTSPLRYRDPVPTPASSSVVPASREALRDVVDMALRCGELLLQHGAATQHVEETVRRLVNGLNCPGVDILLLPNAIVITTSTREEYRTKVRRARAFSDVDMNLTVAINDLMDRFERGELDPCQLRRELARIEHAPRLYSRWLVVAMIGLACASFSRLFGGGWPVFWTTLVASSAAMFIRQELTSRRFNPLLVVMATAFVAGALASAAVVYGIGQHPHIALAASVLLLVPGVPLINSFDDLIHSHLTAGMTRGLLGGVISLSIALGLTLAIGLAGLSGLWSDLAAPPSLAADAFWSAMAALGFALLFNVPRRNLAACLFCAAGGYVVRSLLMQTDFLSLSSIELSTFVAAVVVGFAGRCLHRVTRVPASIYTICAVIPMVPGTLAFGTMINLLQVAGLLKCLAVSSPGTQAVLVLAGENALKTGLVCGALAAGLAIPTLLFDRRRGES